LRLAKLAARYVSCHSCLAPAKADQLQWPYMPSPEHEFIVLELDRAIKRFSESALFGVVEAERKKFDYGCRLDRDLSRPLVAQVLWSYPTGVDKDLRTLIHDNESTLKLYLVKHTTKHLMRIDEVVQSYHKDPTLASKLVGLRPIPVPADFDADDEEHRRWLSAFLDTRLRNDVLFGVLFGRLAPRDFRVFHRHGGPIGLKLAILNAISNHGLRTNPELKERIGYATNGPIREVIAMLTGVGLVATVGRSVLCAPTPKGRLLLDVYRRIYFEWQAQAEWNRETVLILKALDVNDLTFPKELNPKSPTAAPIEQMLISCEYSERMFGTKLLQDVDRSRPRFFGRFDYEYMLQRLGDTPDSSAEMFDDPDTLFFPSRVQ
jgi:hypothetical protein